VWGTADGVTERAAGGLNDRTAGEAVVPGVTALGLTGVIEVGRGISAMGMRGAAR